MSKTKQYKSEIIERLRKLITLETEIKVSNEFAFIDLITELGYREDKFWCDDEDDILSKLMKMALEHTNDQMETINKHSITSLVNIKLLNELAQKYSVDMDELNIHVSGGKIYVQKYMSTDNSFKFLETIEINHINI